MRTYTLEVRLYGVLYIRANSISEAETKAARHKRQWAEFDGAALLDPDVELSPIITLDGPEKDQRAQYVSEDDTGLILPPYGDPR